MERGMCEIMDTGQGKQSG